MLPEWMLVAEANQKFESKSQLYRYYKKQVEDVGSRS